MCFGGESPVERAQRAARDAAQQRSLMQSGGTSVTAGGQPVSGPPVKRLTGQTLLPPPPADSPVFALRPNARTPVSDLKVLLPSL